jgi:predicted ATPase
MTSFKLLSLKHWRQFESVDLNFAPRLCVLTGPNGCGKTTILNVLGRHFGWNLNFLSASFLTRKEKRIYADAWDVLEEVEEDSPDDSEKPQKPEIQAGHRFPIGSLEYTSGQTASIEAPASHDTQYNVIINGQELVVGLHIPSHRPPPGYARLNTIPINPKTAQEHYQSYQNFLFQSYGEHPQRNPSIAMKEALIGFAVFGEGNSSVRPNQEYKSILKNFEEVLRRLLPEHIGLDSIEVDTPDVVLRTKSGRFPLESMSGGLNALFGIAWQIHMNGMNANQCTVLIDEPENHLHPTMQREFLPRLLDAFPMHKFIVATHSPFIVSSTPDAAVYALSYNENRRIVSKLLSESDLAASPNKVLREVLDVPMTMPVWVEQRIQAILAKFHGQGFDAGVIANLRAELRAEGLENAFGDYLAQPSAEDEVK